MLAALVRPLLMLLVLVLSLIAAGASASWASTEDGEDDCCGDKQSPDSSSDDGDETCPPYCHDCACAPLYQQPTAASAVTVTRVAVTGTTFIPATEPPAGPPGPGVFHPPR